MHRYPNLVSGSGNGVSAIALALNAAAKRGAEGCLGVALENRLGVAVKSWDGLLEPAIVGAVAAIEALGEISPYVADRTGLIGRPPVMGGDLDVGHMEPRVELRWS